MLIKPKILKIKVYDFPALEQVRRLIAANLVDHWQLSTLAAKVGNNEFKLKIGFKKLYDNAPYQYLLGLRLDAARGLLENTTLSIGDISNRVSLASYREFSKAFKKMYGLLSSQYRTGSIHIGDFEKD